jgi:hypothetical protein
VIGVGLTLYLSGPMTGYPEQNYPAFARAAAALRARGLTIVSAHETFHNGAQGGDGKLAWAAYLRNDLKELLGCDGIILLPGWPQSAGAKLEFDVAVRLGCQVFFLDTDDRLVDMNRQVCA